MTTNFAFKDTFFLELEGTETENKSIESASIVLRTGLAKFYSTMQEERNYKQECERILDFTEAALNRYSNYGNKLNLSLEVSEIEQIKKALTGYAHNSKQAEAFKKDILSDLTKFQQQVLTVPRQKIMEFVKEKDIIEKQIRVLEYEKNKIITDRLSKILWPFDAKTKSYEQEIAKLQRKLEQYTNKIRNAQTMRAAANEKDIMIYKMQLKEKFATK